MSTTAAKRERLYELLTDRALEGLGAREQIELAELMLEVEDVDPSAFDKAASAVALAALGDRVEPMPAALAALVEASALAALGEAMEYPATDYLKTRADVGPTSFAAPAPHVKTLPIADGSPIVAPPRARTPMAATAQSPQLAPASASSASSASAASPASPASLPRPGSPGSPAPSAAPSNVVPLAPVSPVTRRTAALAVAGWLVAAACLALAVGAFVTRRPVASVTPPPTTPVPTPDLPPVTTPPARETATELRAKLLATAGTLRAEWSSTKDPAGKDATGEVVWNKDLQKGTMTFRGLGKNDPSKLQYQLWIFDKTRDDKYPVDGGLFDIDAESGDVVVPIRAAIPVNAAALFAITIEKPGGVVVSKREHIVLVAKPTG